LRPAATNGAAPHISPAFTPLPVTGKHSVNREPRAYTIYEQKEIEGLLAVLSLPLNSSLSVLAVELLPGPLHIKYGRRAASGESMDAGAAQPAAATAAAVLEDPLGTQLGLRRILRTSPLTKVPAIC
jgi:hypothetical protein